MSHQNMIAKEGFFKGSNPVMMIGSGLLILFFIIFTIVGGDFANDIYNDSKQFITDNLSWYYIGLMSIFLFISIWLIFSRFGKVRLGKETDRPEYSDFAWFSMLFSAGIAIGILFWSIAEPIYHYQSNPFVSAVTDPEGAKQVAMRVTIFHWGLHGWAIFALIGLALSYFSYNKGLPLTIRSALYPIFGEKIYGPIGHIADYLAVFGTVFGIATSLGLGAQQINAGMSYLLGFEVSTVNQIIIIAIVSVVAIGSVLLGVDKGIKVISTINMKLTIVILVLFLILGPTVYILSEFILNFGDYLTNVVGLGFWVNTNPDDSWQGDWTIFYWGWWLSWAPFVGVFIARISKGRTIREFVAGVLVAPTIMGAFWITTFGSTAFYLEQAGAGIIDAVNSDMTMALFKTIEAMDAGSIITLLMAVICVVMLVTYFVTSADSATLVICSLVCMGEKNPLPRYRIFWGCAIGASAAVLLLAGGLKTLQTASVLAALPFSFVIILSVIGLIRALHEDYPTESATLADLK